jgi:hypothetical protein
MGITPHGLKYKTSNYLNKGKPTCPRGHEYTEKNTYWYKERRICRECRRLYRKLRTAKEKIKKSFEPRLVYDGEL